MFPIYINDGTQPLPTDDICYIVAKEGIFLKKKMGIMDSIAPVTNISVLESIQATAQMNIKKIPGGQFARIIAFFREVYKEYYGESIVLLFYDLERKVYKIVPPHQKVTGAACDYNKGITIEGMQMIGTIHSHASMSAFHSGTDDHDEEHFDGLHITIGNVNQEDVSITASIVANGHRFVVQPEDYVERLVKTVDIDETDNKPTRRVFKWQNGKMVEDVQASSKYTYSYRKFDKRYKVDVSARYHKVIPEWMGMVEKGTYTYNYGQYGYGVYGVWDGQNPRYPAPQRGGNRKWGGNYDSDLWRQAGVNVVPAQQGKATEQGKPASPLNVGASGAVIPVQFPQHDIQIEADGHIPCTTCVFRSHKFLQEQEGIEDPDVYKCEKCESIIVDDVMDDSVMLPICPTCKTDEYLILLTDYELNENYVSEKEYSHLKREPGIVEDSAFIQCRSCGNGFHLFAGETQCPFCYTLIDEDQVEGADVVDTEEMRADTMRRDSGDYLTPEAAEVAEAAMDEAQKADEIIERIPDPAEGTIPIAERKEATGFFAHFFGQRSKRK